MLKASSITICGEVKGVGFRRYIWRIAKMLGLRGFIMNIPNSDCVEIYVEGIDSEIRELIDRVLQNRVYTINRVDVVEHEYKGLYTDFMIIKCAGEEGL
ncbi:MAG: acylphosphatase [Ignisphaera sp.]